MSANILPGALPTRIKVAHGVGAVTLGIKESGLTTFFMIYYNQVLGFDPRVVSLVLIGAMVVDAIVDPMIGRLSDATRTRLGRRAALALRRRSADGDRVDAAVGVARYRKTFDVGPVPQCRGRAHIGVGVRNSVDLARRRTDARL